MVNEIPSGFVDFRQRFSREAQASGKRKLADVWQRIQVLTHPARQSMRIRA
jgi:hypothetical protein